MLVLSRKIGEQIVIDGHIFVSLVAIDGGKVRLGITAPQACRVDRAEIHQRRLEEDAGQQPTAALTTALAG